MGRYETDSWPFIGARWFTPIPRDKPRYVRLVVIHDMEFPERLDTAEVIAHDFATRSATDKASAHVCIDADSIIQCVHDRDVAYAAPGANNDGIHIELAGYKRQSRAEWLDEYGVKLLTKAADVVAQYCLKYGIPPVQLGDKGLRDGRSGIVGHNQVSRVYHKSDHSDPGPEFPWDFFMEKVNAAYLNRERL